MPQYNKLSDIQYARFHILSVDLHFETVLIMVSHHVISWLPTLQPQRTPIEHCRESCTAYLAVHYYPLFLIERRNIWPNDLHGWMDEPLSSS